MNETMTHTDFPTPACPVMTRTWLLDEPCTLWEKKKMRSTIMNCNKNRKEQKLWKMNQEQEEIKLHSCNQYWKSNQRCLPIKGIIFQVKLDMLIVFWRKGSMKNIITFELVNLSSNHNLTSSTCNYKDKDGIRKRINLVIRYSLFTKRSQ